MGALQVVHDHCDALFERVNQRVRHIDTSRCIRVDLCSDHEETVRPWRSAMVAMVFHDGPRRR